MVGVEAHEFEDQVQEERSQLREWEEEVDSPSSLYLILTVEMKEQSAPPET